MTERFVTYDPDTGLSGVEKFARVLRQLVLMSGIPFIVMPTGSIADNGVLTSGTALPATYSGGAYAYYPADAIVSGSLAGWYWTVMSSTTAGVIYNNKYVAGQAMVVPATLVPFVTTGPGSYTQTTGSALAGLTVTLPANSLGLNGELLMNLQWSTPNNANAKALTGTFGGTNVLTVAAASTLGGGSQTAIRNRGSASKQYVQQANFGDNLAAVSHTYPAIDTTANANVVLSVQLATATDYFVLESYSFTALKN